MLKKCNRILAFLLALVLVITTFKSDFNGLRVFADDGDENSGKTATEWSQMVDYINNGAVEEPKAETDPEVKLEEEKTEPIVIPEDEDDSKKKEVPVEGNAQNQDEDDANEVGNFKSLADAGIDVQLVNDNNVKAAEVPNGEETYDHEVTVIYVAIDADGIKREALDSFTFNGPEDATYDYNLRSFDELKFVDVETFNDNGLIFKGWKDEDGKTIESMTLYPGAMKYFYADFEKDNVDDNKDDDQPEAPKTNILVYHKNINAIESEKDLKVVSLGEFEEEVTKKPFTTLSYEKVFGVIEDTTKEFLGWRVAAVGDIEEFELTGENNTLHVEKDGKYDLYAIWGDAEPVVEDSTVKVSVYATNGSITDDANLAFENIGLKSVQGGFYEVGVVDLPKELFNGDKGTYINSLADYNTVISAVKEAGIDTSALSGVNAGNTVIDKLDLVAKDYGRSGNDLCTALANADGDYLYRLNLRFETVNVYYDGFYYKDGRQRYNKSLGVIPYIKGSTLTAQDAIDYASDSKFTDGFTLAGVFNDRAMTNTFTGITLTGNKWLVAQYRKGDENAICYFLLGKMNGLTDPNEGPQKSDYYVPVAEYGHDKYIWTGRAIDFSEIDPSMHYYGNDGYVSVYDWSGIDRSVVQYTYDTTSPMGKSTESLINEYVAKDYGANFGLEDVIWYVYKLHKDGKHIDGYVSSFLTYHANLPEEKIQGDVTFVDNRVRWGTNVAVKDNMFTPVDNSIVFLGWSEDPKATEPDKDLKYVQLDDKKHLYAVWGNKYRLKIEIQADAEGKDIDTYQMYDGNVYHGGVAVDVKADIIKANGFSEAVKRVTNTFKKALSLGVLVVYAEEPATTADPMDDEIKDVPAKKITVDGMEVTVSGLKTIAKAGLDVGDYPVTLDYSGMKITTVIDGVEVDIKDMFIVEIEGSKVTDEESKSTTIDPANPKDPEIVAYLHVTKRNVTLTSGSATKQYDGTPLTKDGVTVGGDGFANGSIRGQEGATYNVTGSQTAVGSSGNPFTYTLKPENTFAGNYNITVNYGTLTVTPVPGDNPPPPEENPPTITPPAEGQVLGAVRPVDGAAVLGARRGRTEDSANTLGRIITIIVAAGIGFTMIFIKRKKNEE